MKLKSLAGVVLASALSIACDNPPIHQEYHFDGEIGDEHVYFGEGSRSLRLEVYLFIDRPHPSGDDSRIRQTRFYDYGRDLKVDSVEVRDCRVPTNDITCVVRSAYSRSSDNPKVQELMVLCQQDFDKYLEKIFEINSQEVFGKRKVEKE